MKSPLERGQRGVSKVDVQKQMHVFNIHRQSPLDPIIVNFFCSELAPGCWIGWFFLSTFGHPSDRSKDSKTVTWAGCSGHFFEIKGYWINWWMYWVWLKSGYLKDWAGLIHSKAVLQSSSPDTLLHPHSPKCRERQEETSSTLSFQILQSQSECFNFELLNVQNLNLVILIINRDSTHP